MLKVKPAPVYILDEVDAALDVENTMNIGEMISKHFSDSQFVVVSLQKEMCQNATVQFEVWLENSRSKIQRVA